MNLLDVIIIGKGPAGISAALYTQRANLKTLIIGKDESALKKAGEIENYYGLEGPVSGEKLLLAGEKQAARLGARILDEEVTGVTELYEEHYYKIITTNGEYYSRAVLIATGQPRKTIDIQGLKEFEGKGVSYCTTCDGFFYKGLKVGVLGFNNYAIHEGLELEAFTREITIFTNGAQLDLSGELAGHAGRFKVDTRHIAKLSGQERLEQIQFADGDSQSINGIFVAYGTASSLDFARKLGIETEGNTVRVDAAQSTNLPGIFAAGDCTGGFKQIATAVGQGAVAGKSIIEYVRNLKRENL